MPKKTATLSQAETDIESLSRKFAARHGYSVRKSRAAHSIDNHGYFRLIDSDNRIVGGERFDMTALDVLEYLAGEATAQIQGSAIEARMESSAYFQRALWISMQGCRMKTLDAKTCRRLANLGDGWLKASRMRLRQRRAELATGKMATRLDKLSRVTEPSKTPAKAKRSGSIDRKK